MRSGHDILSLPILGVRIANLALRRAQATPVAFSLQVEPNTLLRIAIVEIVAHSALDRCSLCHCAMSTALASTDDQVILIAVEMPQVCIDLIEVLVVHNSVHGFGM